MEKEKTLKNLEHFAIAYIILFILLIIYNFMNNVPIIIHIASIICILLLIATYKGTKDEKMYGPICSIIVSALMCIGFNIMNIIFALSLLLSALSAIKVIKFTK